MENINNIIESLSQNERKILLLINLPFSEILRNSELDRAAITRSLEFLENKNIIKLKTKTEKIIDLGDNGVVYLKNSLPETLFCENSKKARAMF